MTPLLRTCLDICGGDGDPGSVTERELDQAAAVALAALYPDEMPDACDVMLRRGTRHQSSPHVAEMWEVLS